LQQALIEGARPSQRWPGDNASGTVYGRCAVQPDHVSVVENVSGLSDEFQSKAFAEWEKAGIQLEGVMRDHQVNDHAQLVTSFQQTYGTLPLPANAHPEERNLIDADDALAIDQLMTLKMADAAADQMIQAAQAIEDESTRTAPGTAAMISAAAYIASVESEAYMQKMLAGQLRQEAARLAHDTMSLKRSAWFARDSRNNITDLNR
jgi:hypothetical protein